MDRRKSMAQGGGGDQSAMLKFRRMSRLASVAFRRMSSLPRQSISTNRSGLEQGPLVKLENTFRMEPKSGEKFNSSVVERTLNGTLESYLKGETYDPKKITLLTQNLTNIIKNRIKEIDAPRYKFVVHVVIGERKDQGFQLASRACWNPEFDNYASATYQNSTMFATAMVFACYFE